MKTAVIFDSAGTLLKVYRVAKDVRKGLIVENVASTNIVTLRQGCALVALKVDTFDFLDGLSPGMALSSYIGQANVGMDVICRKPLYHRADCDRHDGRYPRHHRRYAGCDSRG